MLLTISQFCSRYRRHFCDEHCTNSQREFVISFFICAGFQTRIWNRHWHFTEKLSHLLPIQGGVSILSALTGRYSWRYSSCDLIITFDEKKLIQTNLVFNFKGVHLIGDSCVMSRFFLLPDSITYVFELWRSVTHLFEPKVH